jgi:hypothetical protein
VSTLTLHATGTATAGEAWDRYEVFARWPDWSPQITGVDVAVDRIAPGVTGRVRGPLGVALPFAIAAVDRAARQWSWSVSAGPVQLRLTHWVSAGPDGGATTGLRMTGAAPLVIGYAPLALAALRRLVHA